MKVAPKASRRGRKALVAKSKKAKRTTKARAKSKTLTLKAGRHTITMGGPGLAAFRQMMGF